MALLDRRPGRLGRLVLRAPTWLYRARLGWLLGERFACIVHRGRETGRRRRAVVEVVGFDREAREVSVLAGWGPSTQWYRNLEAAPAEEVWVGRGRWRRPGQRIVDLAERRGLLTAYVREHPLAARELGRAFGIGELGEEGIAAMAERARAVAFRPSTARMPGAGG